MSRGHKKLKAEERRRIIARNYLDGLTVRQIAEAMKERGYPIHYSTVARDIQRLKETWQRENVQQIGDMISVEVTRLDIALSAIMSKVRNGDLGAIKYMLEILDRRLKLYGLDNKAVLDALKLLLERHEPGTPDPYAGLSDKEAIELILNRAESRTADEGGTGGASPPGGKLVN